MSYPYAVVVAPGCHNSPRTPIVSRHRTLRAAVRAAMRSDRVRVELADSNACVFQSSSEQPTRYGYGLYGGRHVGTFASALASAERRARELMAKA